MHSVARWSIALAAAVLSGGAIAQTQATETQATQAPVSQDAQDWFASTSQKAADIWRDGAAEWLLSGYAHHSRTDYTDKKLAELNENAWGFGYGRAIDQGDRRKMLYGLAFLDSHKNVQWNIGYLDTFYWGEPKRLQIGLGYTLLIFQRPDVANGVPLPGLLPVVTTRYDRLSLYATYIPKLNSGVNNGSVLFLFSSVKF